LNEGHDDAFLSTLSERDFISLMDADKRIEFTAKIHKLIEGIAAVPSSSLDSVKVKGLSPGDQSSPSGADDGECIIESKATGSADAMDSDERNSGSRAASAPSTRDGKALQPDGNCFDDSTVTYLTRRTFAALGVQDPSMPEDDSTADEPTLRVLFSAGSAGRVDCEYRVIRDDTVACVGDESAATSSSKSERSDALMQLFRDYGAIGPDTLRHEEVEDALVASTRLELCSKNSYDNSLPVFLPDREIITQEEEGDEMCEFMRHDQALLQSLAEAIAGAIERTMASEPLHSVITEAIPAKKDQDEFEENILTSYRHQRVWSSVCRGLIRGVRDQQQDFNQHKLEPLPASWAIKVEGRPLAAAAETEATAKEDSQFDAVCMCCFDGTSHDDDNNKILFCDGCNAAIHQTCYGIPEIPEGEFFCDRCEHIRDLNNKGVLYYEPEELKDVVKCSLCPVYHGALKRTTDGRWVHMCCAIFAKGAVITDLEWMGPVDVSAVSGANEPLQKKPQLGRRSAQSQEQSVAETRMESMCDQSMESTDPSQSSLVPGEGSSSQGSVEPSAACAEQSPVVAQDGMVSLTTRAQVVSDEECCVCGLVGGYMESCSHGRVVPDDHTTLLPVQCSKRFHPLCAWFQGYHVQTFLTDDTYLGLEKDGAFPSGLMFNHFCGVHTPPVAGETLTSGRGEQQDIRSKYVIDVADLCCIPGRAPKRRKNKKKNSAAAMKRVSSSTQRAKDLNVDQYLGNMCAICIEPTQRILEDGDPYKADDCVKCEKCKINVHKRCAEAHGFMGPTMAGISEDSDEKTVGEYVAELERGKNWTCHSCVAGASPSQVGDKTEALVSSADSQPGSQQPEQAVELRCALCPRRGGVFTQLGEGKYAHCYCIDHKPTRAAAMSAKDCKRQNCSYCNRRTGSCARCSHPGGCGQFFHPLCAARAGDSYACIRNGVIDQYCTHHIPSTVCRLANGYWVDTAEVSRLRKSLDQARVILDQVLNREKTKKRMYRLMEENFAKQAAGAIKRLEKKLGVGAADDPDLDATGADDGSDVASTVDLDDILPPSEVKPPPKKRGRLPGSGKSSRVSFDGDSDGDDDDGGYENAAANFKRVGPGQRRSAAAASAGMVIYRDDLEEDDWEDEVLPVRKRGRPSAASLAAEDAFVPANMTKGTPGRKKKVKKEAAAPPPTYKEIPDALRVELSGQDFDKFMVKRASSSQEFHKVVRENLIKTADEYRTGVGIFDSQRSFNDFERKLPKHVQSFMNKTIKDLAMEYDGPVAGAPPESTKKKDKKMKMGDEAVAATAAVASPSSGKRGRPKKNVQAESEAESKVPDSSDDEGGVVASKAKPEQPPPRKKGRVSQGVASSSSKQADAPDQSAFLLELLPHVNVSFVEEMKKRRDHFYSGGQATGGFADIVETLCPSLLQYAGSDWGDNGKKCEKQDVVRLERNIAAVLSLIESVRVPRSGALGNVQDRGSEMKCWVAIRDRLNKGECVSSSRWWEKSASAGKKSASANGRRNKVTERQRKLSSRQAKLDSGYGTVSGDGQEEEVDKASVQEGEEDEDYDPHSRALAEDYEEVPYDLVPEYNVLVMHPLSMSILRERLQKHYYWSFETFAADYYEMLSNGRSITPDGSQTWWDSYVLAQLFAYLRGLLAEPALPNNVLFAATGKGPTPLVISKVANSVKPDAGSSSTSCIRECGSCKCKVSLVLTMTCDFV
jgi:hypothetical protein